MTIERNRQSPNWGIILYGLASLLDGLIMIVGLGFLLSSYRGKTSLWLARREPPAPAIRLQPAKPPRSSESFE